MDAQPLFSEGEQNPCLDFMWQEQAHASETSFLLEGSKKIQIVVANTGDPTDLYRLVEHIDILKERGTFNMFPLGARTLYLDYDAHHQFRWRYRAQRGAEPTVYTYGPHHHSTGYMPGYLSVA
jgi:hypothetical protein